MAYVLTKVNFQSIKNKAFKASEKKGYSIAEKRAKTIFFRAKNHLLKQFEEHNVTQELIAGPRTVNISGTLDGYGNLFSFLGFEQGSNPISSLRQLLENATAIKYSSFRNKYWYFRVTYPTRNEIESATPMPWEPGNSWAYGIEKGVSNLSYYLFKKWKGSRSGYGLQAPYDINDDLSFRPMPYLTPIIKTFRQNILGIK